MAILRYTEGTGSNTTPAIFPTSNTLKNLIMEIANEAKKLREIIYKDITQSTNSPMNKIYEMLKQHLIQTLDKKEFSDIYAQTITYGMLVERFHHRQGSFDGSIFKSVFLETNIIGSIFTEQITSEIREIVNRIEELVSQIAFEKSSKADFIFNFYELFLKYYNSHEKRLKGVYYTPLPVIEYIVNSVDEILKREFNYVEGFANESVTVLDPAAGTMSFLIKIIEKA
ncbi:MAG: N-6 DNA methylase, partial [Spirochaetes bacterium]|nr:N-6 DNA methylase [Spirochaetota bacterium]